MSAIAVQREARTVDLADRSTYLGATDIAAIVGVNPPSYAQAIDVYLEKTGQTIAREETIRMTWGTRLEDIIADAYTEQTGRALTRRGAVQHRDFPFIVGHVDRIVRGEPGVFDAKSSLAAPGYGAPDSDQVPPHVRVQMTVYMGLLGREWCDVALFRSTARALDIYRIPFDAELYDALLAEAVRFWRENVETGVEPEPDGSDAYRRHLAAKFPEAAEVELVATPEQALLMDELRAAEQMAKDQKRHVAELENRIRAAMGAASVLISPVGRITWKAQKPSVRWKEVAGAIAEATGRELQAFVDADKKGRPNERRLRKNWIGAEEEEEVTAA